MLRVSASGEFIGEEARKEGARGAHTIGRHGPHLGRTTLGCGHLVAHIRLPFGLYVLSGKILTLAFVPSNSENIFLLAFLEPKTAENRQLVLWQLVNRLVPENI